MAPSPISKKRAELIREISRDLSRSAAATAQRKSSISTHASSASDNNNVDTDTGLSFDPENEAVVMSTKQLEVTANYNNSVGSQNDGEDYFQTPVSEVKVDSLKFEGEMANERSPQVVDLSDDESVSIEIGRGGGRRSVGSTPSLLKQRGDLVSKGVGDDSLYNAIGYGSQKSQRKSGDVAKRDSQRHSRAALPSQKEIVSKAASYENASRRRTNLADMHAKIINQDGFNIDERPPTTTLPTKNTRFGSSKLRQVSTTTDAAERQQTSSKNARADPSTVLTTPQKRVKSAPAAAQVAAPGSTATQQSFMLPDLPDLTELVSGTRRDGTPIFRRNVSTKVRSRFATATSARTSRADQHNTHIPVDRVPIPTEERAIFASLQLLKEKVSELELYKVEAERRIEEHERDNIELRAGLDVREKMGRNELATRAADEEGGKTRSNWRTEKMRLESSVQSLQSRLERAERKVSVSTIENKRMEKERDNLATQLGAAYYNHEDLKRENEALQLENDTLRDEVDSLRFERERSQKEVKHLRNEILNMRVNFEKHTNQWAREEANLRREKGKTVVRGVNDDDDSADGLDAMTGQAGAYEDLGTAGWKVEEAKLRSKIEQQNDTIKLLQRSTKEKADNYLKDEIMKLRAQLNQHNAARQDWSKNVNFKETDLRRELNQAIIEHQEESDRWAEKEAQLKGKIDKREEVVRQLQLPTSEAAHTSASRRRMAQRHPKTINAGLAGKMTGEGGKSSRLSQPRAEEAPNGMTSRQSKGAAEALRRHSMRSVSHNDAFSKAYQVDDPDDISERNSTTDLEISNPKWRNQDNPGLRPKTAQGKYTDNTDVTLLSFMDSLDIAKLRKMLEEERAAARRESAADAEAEDSEKGNVDMPSGSSLRRPLSKNPKERGEDMPTNYTTSTWHRKGVSVGPIRNKMDDFVRTDNTQQETSHSILSNTSRRRRSAPVEMTSAFTVPDILEHTKAAEATRTAASLANQQSQTQPDIPHEPKDCTICHPDAPIPSAIPVNEHPLPSNVTDNNHDDSLAADAAAIDTTLRPAQPPLEALTYVLKIISDEVTHLKLELRTAESTYSGLDPAIGRRKRKALHTRICKLLSAIEARSEILYKLHDVLEGVKDGSNADPRGGGNHGDAAAAKAFAAAGKEAENTLASLGFDIANIEDLRRKTRKSVTIAEAEAERAYVEDEDEVEDEDSDEDDIDDGGGLYGDGGGGNENTGTAPWEGIADEFSVPMEMATG